MVIVAVIIYIIGIVFVAFFANNEKHIEFHNEKEIAECLNMSDEQFEEEKRQSMMFSNHIDALERALTKKADSIGQKQFDRSFFLWFLGGIVLLCFIIKWFCVDIVFDQSHEFFVHFLDVSNRIDNNYSMCMLYMHICNGLIVLSFVGYILYAVFDFLYKEPWGFLVGYSVLSMAILIELLLFGYTISSSIQSHYYLTTIKEYFGFCNLWQSLIILVKIVIVFICHKQMKKFYKMSVIAESIKVYYKDKKIITN